MIGIFFVSDLVLYIQYSHDLFKSATVKTARQKKITRATKESKNNVRLHSRRCICIQHGDVERGFFRAFSAGGARLDTGADVALRAFAASLSPLVKNQRIVRRFIVMAFV